MDGAMKKFYDKRMNRLQCNLPVSFNCYNENNFCIVDFILPRGAYLPKLEKVISYFNEY